MKNKCSTHEPNVTICAPVNGDFRREVLEGLIQHQKTLPCKYFYDERGSQLFDAICELDEYYPTRTELAIMRRHLDAIRETIGENVVLIEYGSGSGLKSRLLIEAVQPRAYVPIDISGEALASASEALAQRFPRLEIHPIQADYTDNYRLPTFNSNGCPAPRPVVYFPGSTIGNFTRGEAVRFLRHIRRVCESGGSLLIGVDLKKEPSILTRAYNDAEGVTAQFNLNILTRINRELGANFDLEQFEHFAFYNPHEGRIEMHLASLAQQLVEIDGERFSFERGDTIGTEYSHKYSLEEFAILAAQAGFMVDEVWTDPAQLFSVQYLSVL